MDNNNVMCFAFCAELCRDVCGIVSAEGGRSIGRITYHAMRTHREYPALHLASPHVSRRTSFAESYNVRISDCPTSQSAYPRPYSVTWPLIGRCSTMM